MRWTAAWMGVAVLVVAGCSNPWHRDDVGTEASLQAIWFDGASTTWVGGQTGTLLRYDGTEWTHVDTGGLNSIWAIHGSGPNDVWAGGSGGLLLHYDGTAWQQVAAPLEGDDILAIWAFAPDDVIVLTITREFRGSPGAWRELGLMGTYDAIWANSRNDIWLVQGLGDPAHFDGTTWEARSPGLSGLQNWHDAYGEGSTFVMVGADSGNDASWVVTWNGTRWTAEHFPAVDDVQPTYGIGGAGLDELWRVGLFAFAARFDGTEWQTHPVGDHLAMLEDVTVTDDEVIAIGSLGEIWRRPRAIE